VNSDTTEAQRAGQEPVWLLEARSTQCQRLCKLVTTPCSLQVLPGFRFFPLCWHRRGLSSFSSRQVCAASPCSRASGQLPAGQRRVGVRDSPHMQGTNDLVLPSLLPQQELVYQPRGRSGRQRKPREPLHAELVPPGYAVVGIFCPKR